MDTRARKGTHVKGMIELKIAYRSLLKRPIRTLLTVIAVILGVGLFFSVNVATDSLEHSLYLHLGPTEFGNANRWVYLFRGILMVLSGISLIICVIIIKNLMEMSKEAQIYEIGLLRAIGSSKKSLFLTFFFQVLIIALIGMILGLFFGYFLSYLFFNPLRILLNNFYALDPTFEIELYVKDFTLILGMLAGLGIPLIFGTIPAISAARSNVIAALNQRSQARKTNLHKLRSFILQAILSISLISIGIFIIRIGFAGLLSFTSDPTAETNMAIISLFFAGLIFICGSVLFGTLFLPYISYFFSTLLYPFLLKTKKICYRNLVKNSRRTKNTFLMISIGLSFLITVNITEHSIEAGIVPGAHMRLGGDICLSMYYSSHQRIIPLNTSNNISKISHVSNVCEVKNSHYNTNYTTCDDFGTKEGEHMILFVINTTSYVQMHSSESIYSYTGDKSFHDFIHQLDVNGTVILQDGLSSTIQKSEGQIVNITTSPAADWFFPAMSVNLTIVGIMGIMPGIRFTWDEDLWPDETEFAAIISWNTYFNLTGETFDKTFANFWIECDDIYQSDDVLDEISNLYQTLGNPWATIDFSEAWSIRTIVDEITGIREILSLVIVVVVAILYMAIIISMLGLITSMIMNINQRRNEIGVLRSIGISKYQIMQIVFGETLVICAATLITGIICGITTALLISNVPFMAYTPIFFTLRWEDITNISIFMVSLSLFASIVPAIKALRLSIIDAIRKRGM